MAVKAKLEAQNPLILRSHRLMDAFAKSDDERDFYLDRLEGFIVYVELDKPQQDIEILEKELSKNGDRYCAIPKLTFYETKKIMEGFVNEKVYDIDTKEKLLDIIQSKDARTNFLEFIYDHHTELDKWQQYYQERSRIRIIEWLRNNHFHFVFEEDLEMSRSLIEKLKQELFQTRVGKEVLNARKVLVAKAKTYYSSEALNPRPKRGRPPKQVAKLEIEPQLTTDIYTTVPLAIKLFLFVPDITSASAVTFSSKFENTEQMLASRKPSGYLDTDANVESITKKLAMLRSMSSSLTESASKEKPAQINWEDDEDDEEEGTKKLNGKKRPAKRLNVKDTPKPSKNVQRRLITKTPANTSKAVKKAEKPSPKLVKKIIVPVKTKPKRIIPKIKPTSKTRLKPLVGKPVLPKANVKAKAKIIPKKVIPKKAGPANAKRRLQPAVKRKITPPAKPGRKT